MSSFEWMELQTLTSEIDTARTRLLDARKKRDHGRIRTLEDEITQAEQRRLQLVAHISTSIATEEDSGGLSVNRVPPAARQSESAAAEAETQPAAAEAAGEELAEAAVGDDPVAVAEGEAPAEAAEAETAPSRRPRRGGGDAETEAAAVDQPDGEAPSGEPDEPSIEVATAASPAPAAKTTSLEGGITMWDQLTPTDIDRAKRELGIRRAEILARHAEELKSLEVEQGQIDTLEQAIASFLQKFNAAGGEAAAVVKLDQERELRQQGNS